MPITINNAVVNLQVISGYVKNGSTETRNCTLNFSNKDGMFPLVTNTAVIAKAEKGADPSSSVFNYTTYSAYLYYTTNTVNATNYTYANTNGIQYGNSYYIPVKLMTSNNIGVSFYAYMQVTITAEKLTIDKLVYNTLGSLVVGQN